MIFSTSVSLRAPVGSKFQLKVVIFISRFCTCFGRLVLFFFYKRHAEYTNAIIIKQREHNFNIVCNVDLCLFVCVKMEVEAYRQSASFMFSKETV